MDLERLETCPHCDGKGREWHMQGGPHGIGRMGKCHVCKGDGNVTEAKYRWYRHLSTGPEGES